MQDNQDIEAKRSELRDIEEEVARISATIASVSFKDIDRVLARLDALTARAGQLPCEIMRGGGNKPRRVAATSKRNVGYVRVCL